jgi:hypothetical protein
VERAAHELPFLFGVMVERFPQPPAVEVGIGRNYFRRCEKSCDLALDLLANAI